MRHVLVTALALVLCESLGAQEGAPRRIQPITPGADSKVIPGAPAKPEAPKAIPLEQKLRYICKQLDLDARQQQHVEGLFAEFKAESDMSQERTKERMDAIMATFNEMQEAQKAGDTARADELRERLRSLAPGAALERGFVEGLLPVLNEGQRAKFERLMKELETATDLSLKPVEVVRIARGLELKPEQNARLEQVQQAFRQKAATSTTKEQDDQSLERLISDVRALLNADQAARFDKEIDRRRLDPPPAPATAPAAGVPMKNP